MGEKNLEAVWVKILRGLREEKKFALFGLLSNLDDVAFSNSRICLLAHNEGEKSMLKQHLCALQKLAGDDVEIEIQDVAQAVKKGNDDFVVRLKELFGDKVEIV